MFSGWRRCALGYDHLRATFVHVFDDPIRIERLVGDQATECDILKERSDADGVIVLSGQENEADQIAERIRQGQDFGAQPAP
jgi:hypothetical protein